MKRIERREREARVGGIESGNAKRKRERESAGME